ncbi:X2-like carbohydrate binding domain-containing protein [Desulfosporosinus sp. BICA1-9]|uniref:X2-like carbohydrate binding domain-containing protein n=1 Tax=Desulfosporosinus sp. BICA1-9 TaxID=1531958 RepID=UPI00054BF0CE|nr:X2-like carbohydrate binding domain-containing protein [Desulfosporosinus sp. BICA1-9]KJS48614.1 MAG: hypothetical protein VR66_13055 [Peptococcaceae bacterium BRH_c23]KJS81513.1 MAG: hypothetical protein JL57_26450 [Desulfosporosinus sp. BICA1-9]HBW35206.1 hypothetical protein [Desulfosporosinus sp.]
MKRKFRKFYLGLLIAVMMLSILVMQIPLAKPAYAATDSNSTIAPVTAVFDKNPSKQADISVTMAVYGNDILNSIANGETTLTAGSDL